MKAWGFLFFLIFFFFVVGAGTGSGQIYKWVDEKGTVHFSENPTSGDSPKKDQGREKSDDRSPAKPKDKVQRDGVEKKQEKQAAKESGQLSLKHMEVGSRYIPEDMKKYGPGGGSERPRGADGSAPGGQRSSS